MSRSNSNGLKATARQDRSTGYSKKGQRNNWGKEQLKDIFLIFHHYMYTRAKCVGLGKNKWIFKANQDTFCCRSNKNEILAKLNGLDGTLLSRCSMRKLTHSSEERAWGVDGTVVGINNERRKTGRRRV